MQGEILPKITFSSHSRYKMKTCVLIVLALVALCASKSIKKPSDRILGLITQYGYPVESKSVTTEDGYILQLIRIPGGFNKDQESSDNQDKSEEFPTKSDDKPAVLLMHGFMSSAEDFVYGGPTQGLAFRLADQGYDVYLGNARGSIYGQGHTTLNPKKDAAFWKFCWQEIGTKDLPAIIDKVLSWSEQKQLRFIGHMEGATAFYVLASERPYYNEKVEQMMALGPIAFMKSTTHPLLRRAAEKFESKHWIMKNLGVSTFKPSSTLMEGPKTECLNTQSHEICDNTYFTYKGYQSKSLNETIVRQALRILPTGGSVREVLHFAQLVESGKFQTLSLEDQETHEFDLSKVQVPVAIYYAPMDPLSHVEDVEKLRRVLPNVYKAQLVNRFHTNMEMIYGQNVDFFYRDVIRTLREAPRNREDKNFSL